MRKINAAEFLIYDLVEDSFLQPQVVYDRQQDVVMINNEGGGICMTGPVAEQLLHALQDLATVRAERAEKAVRQPPAEERRQPGRWFGRKVPA